MNLQAASRSDDTGDVHSFFDDPIAVLKLADIAKDVRARLERVRDQLKG